MHFLEIEVENLDESSQDTDRAMKQKKQQVTRLQIDPQKILKMENHGDVKINIKVHIKVKQLMTTETQKLKTDVDFQIESNIRISSDVCKEKFQSYSEKLKIPKMKRPKGNYLKEETHSGNIVKQFKGRVHEGPFYVCQIYHRCLFSIFREILKINFSSQYVLYYLINVCIFVKPTIKKL